MTLRRSRAGGNDVGFTLRSRKYGLSLAGMAQLSTTQSKEVIMTTDISIADIVVHLHPEASDECKGNIEKGLRAHNGVVSVQVLFQFTLTVKNARMPWWWLTTLTQLIPGSCLPKSGSVTRMQ
jgi:hypothetical protein